MCNLQLQATDIFVGKDPVLSKLRKNISFSSSLVLRRQYWDKENVRKAYHGIRSLIEDALYALERPQAMHDALRNYHVSVLRRVHSQTGSEQDLHLPLHDTDDLVVGLVPVRGYIKCICVWVR
ncbi:hypothetical protein D9615_003343 [Tricholomella constricta]|uniref:Uncharacterized protein n=1 Tax=Tricholomella constricta TaxID=117010 RepID=A0A8H5HIS8_9AGAR|nr:hypothetical protein D9615_003343 [Tricholomella constricta]